MPFPRTRRINKHRVRELVDQRHETETGLDAVPPNTPHQFSTRSEHSRSAQRHGHRVGCRSREHAASQAQGPNTR
eukprot:9321097-Heterocapsa_arctica.AAC.1